MIDASIQLNEGYLSMGANHHIAVIPGDGIGMEVVPEGVRVLNAAAAEFDFHLDYEEFDFASVDYYLKTGAMLPDNWFEQLRGFDAIFFGAVGWPEVVPDHISLWGSLLQFRRHFDQYVNLRPVKLMPGVVSPLAGRGPGDVDFYVVRENTEGEYSSIGGKIFEGTDRETVVQETVMTRVGVDRILDFAFKLAQSRPKKHLTSATKSNGISITMPYWDERVVATAERYPDVDVDKYHIDISPRTSSYIRIGSTSSSPAICSVTSCRTWGRPVRARSVSHLVPTSTPRGAFPVSSNPCTAPRPTLPARESQIRWVRSGAPA